jgi:trk system potassium uptake protein TrkA
MANVKKRLDVSPLCDDFDLVQLEPPPEFVGHSLKELNLRARHNVQVIAIKRSGANGPLLIPAAEYVVGGNEVLMMLGKTANLRKVRTLV